MTLPLRRKNILKLGFPLGGLLVSLASGLAAGVANLSVDAGVQVNTFVPAQAFGANLLPYISRPSYAAVQPKLQDAGAGFYVYPSGFANDYHWNSTGSFNGQGHWVPSATAFSPGFQAHALHRGSTSNYGHPAVAGDGDPATDWLSHSDTDAPQAQWLYVDLGSNQSVDGAQVQWGNPHATRFSIQYWNPASSNQWAPYLHASNDWLDSGTADLAGNGGLQALSFTAVSSRYVRLLMTESSVDPAQYAVAELRFYAGAVQLTRNNAVLNGVQPDQSPMLSSSVDPACSKGVIGDFDFDSFMGYVHSFHPSISPMINVNFGGGTPQEAAAWVHYANVVKGYGIKHWSLGNEMHGYWEMGGPLSARDYARRYLKFYQAMKAVDPGIIIGGPVCGDPYNATSNDYDGLNYIQGFVQHLQSDPSGDRGMALEALVFHWYPYITGSDPAPYYAGTARWAQFAADLPGWLAGLPQAASLPLFNTEYNSNVGGGPFSTSRANGLWLALNAGEFLTHFGSRASSAYWTVMHPNDAAGSPTGGDQSWFQLDAGPHQYQERATFWSQSLLASAWAIPADTRSHSLVQVNSDQPALKAYANRRPDGQLALLLINTDSVNAYDVQVSLNGFSAAPGAGLLRMDASTYDWSLAAAPYYALPSLPPAVDALTVAGNSVQCAVGPGSLSVLRFYDAADPDPTVTPRASSTPTPNPTATACVRAFNPCDSPTDNGAWIGSAAQRSWVDAATAPAGALTEGGACLRVSLTALSNWNDQILNLESFVPLAWTGAAALRLDLYVDTSLLAGGTYAQLALRAEASSQALYYQPISQDQPVLTAGANPGLTFRLDWSAGTLNAATPLSRLIFILSTNATGQGSLYVDNLRLLDACGLAAGTPVPTQTLTPTLIPTPTPSPTPPALPDGPLEIRTLRLVPNPNPAVLAVDMAGSATGSELSLYSPSLRKVGSRQAGPLRPGWNQVSLDPEWTRDLAAGLYFVELIATRSGERSRKAVARMLRLPGP